MTMRCHWTQEEDFALQTIITSMAKAHSTWRAAADALGNTKTPRQVNCHLHPNKENTRLFVLIIYLLRDHHLCRVEIGQCRERWRNVLDPSINRGLWTPEEDRLFISGR
eukprot:c18939_g1_i7.p2 GENE.c18939_g1_i7~~c18939_g1_i7.p2  ORF type:complete len:109 (-),score=21.52 c18939_g1_i7:593-919(-)